MRWRPRTFESKVRKWSVWRPWFAWHPVTIGTTRVWLEVIERRYDYVNPVGQIEGFWRVYYRFPTLQKGDLHA